MQAVILAAGRGRRLHPFTLKRSKAMMPVAGKPMVGRVLDRLIQNEVSDLIMVTGPGDHEIRRYFQEQSLPGISLKWVVQPEPLGMAQALSLAAPYLGESFLLSSCDNLTPVSHVADLLATHHSRKANATLSLMEMDSGSKGLGSTVQFDQGQVRRIIEKPAPNEILSQITSLPLYIFSPLLLDCLSNVSLSPSGEHELQSAIQLLIERKGKVAGVFTPSRMQLTQAEDLLALNRHYLSRHRDPSCLPPDCIGSGTQLVPPLGIEPGTTIGSHCTIGPDVYIESNCTIGANVLLQDAVILRETQIENGQVIVGQVLAPESTSRAENRKKKKEKRNSF